MFSDAIVHLDGVSSTYLHLFLPKFQCSSLPAKPKKTKMLSYMTINGQIINIEYYPFPTERLNMILRRIIVCHSWCVLLTHVKSTLIMMMIPIFNFHFNKLFMHLLSAFGIFSTVRLYFSSPFSKIFAFYLINLYATVDFCVSKRKKSQ